MTCLVQNRTAIKEEMCIGSYSYTRVCFISYVMQLNCIIRTLFKKKSLLCKSFFIFFFFYWYLIVLEYHNNGRNGIEIESLFVILYKTP